MSRARVVAPSGSLEEELYTLLVTLTGGAGQVFVGSGIERPPVQQEQRDRAYRLLSG